MFVFYMGLPHLVINPRSMCGCVRVCVSVTVQPRSSNSFGQVEKSRVQLMFTTPKNSVVYAEKHMTCVNVILSSTGRTIVTRIDKGGTLSKL